MEDFNDFKDDFSNEFEDSNSFSPQSLEGDNFKQRNDPEKLLFRFRLDLLNAYEVTIKVLDSDSQEYKTVTKIKRKKNTNPKCNSQGVADIISYMEKFINSHTVQGNIPSAAELKTKMRFIANDLTMHFISNKETWGLSLDDTDILISNAINLIELFLSRTLFNEERKGYGESYKETTTKNITEAQKSNSLQKVANFLAGGRSR